MTAVEAASTLAEHERLEYLALLAAHEAAHALGAGDCKPISDAFFMQGSTGEGSGNALVAVVQSTDQEAPAAAHEQDRRPDVNEHISSMWDRLSRTTRLSPRHPDRKIFIPGERFIENYYWDNLEVMRGLAVEGRWDDVRGLVEYYAEVIDEFGYIPNGTREELTLKYFEGRSQPPVFAEMVELLAEYDGEAAITRFLGAMRKEHGFWMAGEEQVAAGDQAHRRVVGAVGASGKRHTVNRYFSDKGGPRAEVLCVDNALITQAVMEGRDPDQFTIDIRAACESGWDFSSRWLADKRSLTSICATQIAPVDLNCNLFKLEQMLARGYELSDDQAAAAEYYARAAARAEAIEDLFWDEHEGFYFDYNFVKQAETGEWSTGVWSLAGGYPLDYMPTRPGRAERVLTHLRTKFLKAGGLMATLEHTHHQWDGENGWAPLQFRMARAAWRKGDRGLAFAIRANFMRAIEEVFAEAGKIPEKVNVFALGLEGNKGEYPPQWGFGWTNGVYRALQYFTFTEEGHNLRNQPGETFAEGYARRVIWMLGVLGMNNWLQHTAARTTAGDAAGN